MIWIKTLLGSLLPTEDGHRVQFADEDFVPDNGDMSPGLFFSNLARVKQLELRRIRLDQEQLSLFVEGENLVTIRDQGPVFAE